MSFIYILAGLLHFIKPKVYLRIIPNYLPYHKLIVYLSGFIEIILGICVCIPALKNISIVFIILMLLVFLLVHVYMINNKKASAGLPMWLLILRIPIQFILIYWAYSYLSI